MGPRLTITLLALLAPVTEPHDEETQVSPVMLGPCASGEIERDTVCNEHAQMECLATGASPWLLRTERVYWPWTAELPLPPRSDADQQWMWLYFCVRRRNQAPIHSPQRRLATLE